MFRIIIENPDCESYVFAHSYADFDEPDDICKDHPYARVEQYSGGMKVDYDAPTINAKELD
jgi:hypothetical protein